MTEQKPTYRFNPETGKPNPVSVREVCLMDRNELRAFFKPLGIKEKMDFQFAFVAEYSKLSLKQRIEIAQAEVEKYSKRESMNIADKIELALAKLSLKNIMQEKKSVSSQKPDGKRELKLPKWVMEKKSPYLIGA